MLSIVNNRAFDIDAELVVQRALVKMWEKYDTFDGDSNFMVWGSAFLKHEISNAIRIAQRYRKRVPVSVEELEEGGSKLFFTVSEDNEHTTDDSKLGRLNKMMSIVNRLKPEERNLLISVLCDNEKIKDLAERDGVPLQTYYNKISLLKKKLKKTIENYGLPM